MQKYDVSLNGEHMTYIHASSDEAALKDAVKEYGLEVDVTEVSCLTH